MKVLHGGAFTCSGALIGSRTVLTAAHCAVPSGSESLLAVELDLGGSAPGQQRGVVAQYLPPGWDIRTGAHDLLLLQLDRDIPQVTPLPLFGSPLTDDDIGRPLRVLGYGSTLLGPSSQGIRREVTLVIRQLLPLRLEAGTTERQACAGDSGGPALLQRSPTDSAALVATVSDGDQSCQTTGFYARVDVDLSWLQSTAAAWDTLPGCGRDGACFTECAPRDPDCPSSPSTSETSTLDEGAAAPTADSCSAGDLGPRDLVLLLAAWSLRPRSRQAPSR